MFKMPNSYYDPPEEPDWCDDCDEYVTECACREEAELERAIDNEEARLEAQAEEAMNAEVEWESPW